MENQLSLLFFDISISTMTFLLFLVVILFLLAITDLIVGVSNDAVNFLNSAIGSRVASFRTIILIAAAGVILGSVFSSGIMEIARKGIFYPEFFTLDKLMFIFLAVMLADIVLLDVFNSLGLPTSTTVSIIFELLGAALVAGVLFSIEKQEPVTGMFRYINFGSVASIVSGIFLSIIIAFTMGIVVQYLCRLLFTFNYEQKLNRYGAIFAGVGITVIIYFLLIKGLKGTTLISKENLQWIKQNTVIILSVIFILSTTISRVLQKTANVNPLKVIVFLGTFSLAMAFAGNDLVNFIGVPITGFLAYQNWQGSGIAANEHYQGFLSSSNVIVPNYMLLIAGLVMALTLWLSAKAKKVTETEVNLGSQGEVAEERFRPNAVSRSVVKSSIVLGNLFSVILPSTMSRYYNLNFEKSKIRQAATINISPAFDLVRASVNLILASALIALATSMKLPLSTTYVSFMVAMGTSLADKAWGRETAVYRVAGVLSVIGGWFITAFIAFGSAALFVFILIKGGMTGTIILIGLVAVYIIFSHIYFSKKSKIVKTSSSRLKQLPVADQDIYSDNKNMVIEELSELISIYKDVLEKINEYDGPGMEKAFKKLKAIESDGFKQRAQSIRNIKNLETDDPKPAQILLYSSDLLHDITNSAVTMSEECKHYIQNLHQQPGRDFIRLTRELSARMDSFFTIALTALKQDNYEDLEYIKIARDDVREFINDQLDRYIKMVQVNKTGTKQAILESNILLQSRDMLAVTLRIIKMYRRYLKEK